MDLLLKRAEELAASKASRMGIVTNGTSSFQRNFDFICGAAVHIVECVDIQLRASLGLLTHEQGTALRQAGFTRFHRNLETAASDSVLREWGNLVFSAGLAASWSGTT
ncbi:MAG: hypothetical protein LBR94_02350 [Desulfovibrio sp.]|jgi:biotin synthase|nr:hypothetical protein [Desulfovibrio sp.]